MKRILGATMVLVFVSASARSADEKAMAVIDKAIEAMGGQERLEKAQMVSSSFTSKVFSRGKELAGTRTVHQTIQGLENRRQVTEIELNGMTGTLILVMNGDQAWQQTPRGTKEVPLPTVNARKQTDMPELLAAHPDVLKSTGFEVAWAGEGNVEGRPAVILKVTGLNVTRLKISYDNESGLPIKTEARLPGAKRDMNVETLYSEYKDFDGIKVATKIEFKADGERIKEAHITEFKILDKVPPETFAEPK